MTRLDAHINCLANDRIFPRFSINWNGDLRLRAERTRNGLRLPNYITWNISLQNTRVGVFRMEMIPILSQSSTNGESERIEDSLLTARWAGGNALSWSQGGLWKTKIKPLKIMSTVTWTKRITKITTVSLKAVCSVAAALLQLLNAPYLDRHPPTGTGNIPWGKGKNPL